MPDLVRDDLVIGVLHHEADLLGLVPVRNLFQRNAPEQNFAGAFAVGGEDGFQLPQEGTLAAAGLAAESNKFSLLNRQTDIFQTVLSLGGSVGKRQILDLEMCHCTLASRPTYVVILYITTIDLTRCHDTIPICTFSLFTEYKDL